MTTHTKIVIEKINPLETLKKPMVCRFWSPVKECHCTVKMESTGNGHWVSFRYRDVSTKEWKTEQTRWSSLSDAMEDFLRMAALWSTEVYSGR